MAYADVKTRIQVWPWEDGEFIITLDGNPIGRAVRHSEARVIADWLATSLREIERNGIHAARTSSN